MGGVAQSGTARGAESSSVERSGAAAGRSARASKRKRHAETPPSKRPLGARSQAAALARRRKREYMRKWRANPSNRENERLRSINWRWNRTLERCARRLRASASAPRKCAYCHRDSIMTVERAAISRGEFVPVQVPYCGDC